MSSRNNNAPIRPLDVTLLQKTCTTADGTYAVLFDEPYDKTDEELAEKIECSRGYIRLPNQYAPGLFSRM